MESNFAIFAFLLCVVAVRGKDDPIITTLQQPSHMSGDVWTFQEITKIDLLCSHPRGKIVHWNRIIPLQVNPIHGQGFSNVSSETKRPIQMTIFYNKQFFDNMLNISCYSTDNTHRRNTTAVRIEQLYKTKNVVINDGKPKVKVNPAKKPVLVHLQCRADGNPPPYFGKWYKRTSTGTMTIIPPDASKLDIYYQNGTKFKYQCEAKNYRNFVQSDWVEVDGSHIVKSSWVLLVVAALASWLT